MTDRELMQQALDLLDDINQCSLPPTGIPLPAEIDHVMETLRARLAQHQDTADKCKLEIVPAKGGLLPAQQEPVAFICSDRHGDVALEWDKDEDFEGGLYSYEPLYTAQPQREWQGLTDDDIKTMWGSYFSRGLEFARAIEAKLKEKNT